MSKTFISILSKDSMMSLEELRSREISDKRFFFAVKLIKDMQGDNKLPSNISNDIVAKLTSIVEKYLLVPAEERAKLLGEVFVEQHFEEEIEHNEAAIEYNRALSRISIEDQKILGLSKKQEVVVKKISIGETRNSFLNRLMDRYVNEIIVPGALEFLETALHEEKISNLEKQISEAGKERDKASSKISSLNRQILDTERLIYSLDNKIEELKEELSQLL